jgi:hypothetical protein
MFAQSFTAANDKNQAPKSRIGDGLGSAIHVCRPRRELAFGLDGNLVARHKQVGLRLT